MKSLCSESCMCSWKLFQKPAVMTCTVLEEIDQWQQRKAGTEIVYAAFGTIFIINNCFQRSKQKLLNWYIFFHKVFKLFGCLCPCTEYTYRYNVIGLLLLVTQSLYNVQRRLALCAAALFFGTTHSTRDKYIVKNNYQNFFNR
jgi:hypothetical protein